MFSKIKYLARLFLSIILLLICFTCSTPSINLDTTNTQNDLEGAYEFISEENDFTVPGKNKYERRYPDWSGLWIFKDGHFSRVIMKSNSSFQKKSPKEN